MIKINLLSEGRRPVVARKAKPKLGLGDMNLGNLALFGGIALGVAALVVWWVILNAAVNDAQQEVARAEKEYQALQHIIKEVDEFERKKANLERKVQVIRELKDAQKGPVQIMDQVSRALPDLLWLSQMSLVGSSVNLTGEAFNTNAVAAFIENLDKVPEFSEPSTSNIRAVAGMNGYTFNLSFQVQRVAPEGEADATESAGR